MSNVLKGLLPLFVFLFVISISSCGGKKAQAEESRPANKIRGVVSYKKSFGDLNDVHLLSAKQKGIAPLSTREEADSLKNKLLLIRDNEYYQLDPLKHSIPYLVPSAGVLLGKIGANFQDSLRAKGLCPNKLIVTSVLRTQDDVKKLRKRNGNASLNSAHFYGTTFDVSYRRFQRVETGAPTDSVSPEKLKLVLAEVLRDLRQKDWCYIKYELKQGCFHITTRL